MCIFFLSFLLNVNSSFRVMRFHDDGIHTAFGNIYGKIRYTSTVTGIGSHAILIVQFIRNEQEKENGEKGC